MLNNGHRILIVDDEPTVADVTARILQAEFPSVPITVNTTAEKAIQSIREKNVAVLLCDLQMPVFDGTAILKEAYDSNANVVSILVTGRATKDGMIRALNEGHLWRCIEKPWFPAQLCEAVKEAVEIYNRRSTIAAPQPEKAVAPAPLAAVAAAAGKQPKQITMQRKPPKPGPHARIHRMAPSAKPRFAPKSKERRLRIMDKRYRDLTLVKEGGTGAIYKAHDTLLGIPVAIKVVSETFTRDKKSLTVLFQEARIAMQLSHKHIVRLHNIEESKGFYYLVMEYIDGCTMRQLLEKLGTLPPKMVLQVADICEDALGYAHRHNVYHRDLKPDNLMLTENGVLKIIDFGLACLAENRLHADEIWGTPFYMSPEEIAGTALDHRADIYSLGITIHEFLSGELPPHSGDTEPRDILEYAPMASPDLPEAVRSVLERGFARSPEHRWATIHEFARNFREAFAVSYPAI